MSILVDVNSVQEGPTLSEFRKYLLPLAEWNPTSENTTGEMCFHSTHVFRIIVKAQYINLFYGSTWKLFLENESGINPAMQ